MNYIESSIIGLRERLNNLVLNAQELKSGASKDFFLMSARIIGKRILRDTTLMQALKVEDADKELPFSVFILTKANARLKIYLTEVENLEHHFTNFKSKRISHRAYSISSNMGFTWPWESDVSSPSDDRARGLELLQHYYDEAVSIKPSSFATFDDFLSSITSRGSDLPETLGMTIRVNDNITRNVTMSTAKTQLEKMAQKLQGEFPKNLSDYVTAAGAPLSELGWLTDVEPLVNELAERTEYFKDLSENLTSAAEKTATMIKYAPLIIGVLGLGVGYLSLKKYKVI